MALVTPSLTRVREIVSGFSRVRVVVVGDLVADEFIYGQIDRVSREAPVLILGYTSTEVVPGGAGNAANNAAALGAGVAVVGVVGTDEMGARVLSALPASASVSSVVRAASYSTPVKTRILAGGTHSAKQQVVRIDRAGGPMVPAVRKRIVAALARAIRRADVVIVSDYGIGAITPDILSEALAASRRTTPPHVLVDSRYALTTFPHITACTPNESELESIAGVRIGEDRRVLEKAGRSLLRRLACEAVLVTRGSRGMALFVAGAPTEHIPIVGSDQVTDVTGAGDTVIAVFSLALSAGASFAEAAHLANHAGGLVVMKRGTATVTARELLDGIEGGRS
jgi:rfaE bifunctional protein kinase chain/domain